MAAVTVEELLEAMPPDAILQFYEEVRINGAQADILFECEA
jgi:hypothetical protein